jgi:hypothetical protein
MGRFFLSLLQTGLRISLVNVQAVLILTQARVLGRDSHLSEASVDSEVGNVINEYQATSQEMYLLVVTFGHAAVASAPEPPCYSW